MRKHYVVPLEKKPKAKCRQWQLRVDSGRKTPKGAISWKTRKVTGVTWSQANEMCDQWAVDLDEGRAVIPDRRWTFSEYREHWAECALAEGFPAAGTVKVARSALKAIGIHLDGIVLTDLTASDVNAAVSALMRGESASGSPVSGTYARKVLGCVRRMVEHARKAGVVASNVALDAMSPAEDTPEKAPVPMQKTAAMEAALDPADWRERAVLLLAETGMRQCEVMPPDPMLWAAWDEDSGTIQVRSSKNSNGLRIVPVTSTLAVGLAVAKLHVQLCLDEADVSSLPMLCADDGRARTKSALQQWWTANRARWGLDGVGLHQLRHAMVTDLLANGTTLKEAQDIIGDKSGATVLGVYAHTTVAQRAEAMRSLDEARHHVQSLYKKDGS